MSVKLERDKNFVPIDDLTRRDLQIISNMVDAGSRVLDIGCGNSYVRRVLLTRASNIRNYFLIRESRIENIVNDQQRVSMIELSN